MSTSKRRVSVSFGEHDYKLLERLAVNLMPTSKVIENIVSWCLDEDSGLPLDRIARIITVKEMANRTQRRDG
jgi:hypothetical protein